MKIPPLFTLIILLIGLQLACKPVDDSIAIVEDISWRNTTKIDSIIKSDFNPTLALQNINIKNNKGRISNVYYEGSVVSDYRRFLYDEKGRLYITRLSHNFGSNIQFYQYKGNYLYRIYDDSEIEGGRWQRLFEYRYNDKNQLDFILIYVTKDNSTYYLSKKKVQFQYDNEGKLSKRMIVNTDTGEHESYKVFTWKNGNVTQVDYYSHDNFSNRIKFQYDNKSNPFKNNLLIGDAYFRYSYLSFDLPSTISNNNIIKLTYEDVNKTINFTIDFNFNYIISKPVTMSFKLDQYPNFEYNHILAYN